LPIAAHPSFHGPVLSKVQELLRTSVRDDNATVLEQEGSANAKQLVTFMRTATDDQDGLRSERERTSRRPMVNEQRNAGTITGFDRQL
jgi:hypothetical protein